MVRVSPLSAVLLLTICVVATVTAFRYDDEAARKFGRDFFDRKYQDWRLGKRGGGSGLSRSSWGAFGQPVGDHLRYFNWKDYFAHAIHNHKRQLSFGPRSFGNYRWNYFTDGLQDWKNTVRDIYTRKRDAFLGEDRLDDDASASAIM